MNDENLEGNNSFRHWNKTKNTFVLVEHVPRKRPLKTKQYGQCPEKNWPKIVYFPQRWPAVGTLEW